MIAPDTMGTKMQDELTSLAVRILQSMQPGKEYVVKWEKNEKGELTAKVEALEK